MKAYTLSTAQYALLLQQLQHHADFEVNYISTPTDTKQHLYFLKQAIEMNFDGHQIRLDDQALNGQDKRQLHKKIRGILKSLPTPNQSSQKPSHQTITQAKIIWTTDKAGNLVPTSDQFDDVYFSHANGLSESCYVFIEQNQLPKRFLAQHLAQQHAQTAQYFVIGETGFGTGLNFLATCHAWQIAHQQAQSLSTQTNPPAILHFISTEKYPLKKHDLQTALATWRHHVPKLAVWIDALIHHYPLAIAGCHRRFFEIDGVCVLLDLWLGDAKDSLTQLTQQTTAHLKIDAWFLDGFAPSKNSELWSVELFALIKQLSKKSTTLATFTAAGHVKRHLQQLGASVLKVKGFGHKREMICANFEHAFDDDKQPSRPKTALIIGAGISGLMAAYSLSLRGITCTLIDKVAPLNGASGNPRALLSPKLTHASYANIHLATSAHLYANWLYHTLSQRQSPPLFSQTGTLDLFAPNPKSHDKLSTLVNSYPNDFIWQTANFQDQIFTAFFAQAGLVNPQQLSAFILSQPRIHFCTLDVKKIHQDTHGIFITDNRTNTTLQADIAIICAGFESHQLGDVFECRKIRGQVSWWHDSQAVKAFNQQLATITQSSSPACAIKYDGYACTFDDGKPTLLCGASFVRNDTKTDIRPSEHQTNQDKLAQYFPNLSTATPTQGRASIRAQTPDYHPIAGQIDRRLYVMTGMGSKGFALAPLCAEILVSSIMGEFLPTTTTILDNIHPKRPRLQTPINQSD